MARPTCKELLLDAAEAVVIEGGAGRLTLDAVAEKAGVSKGGLLYHFPSKEALLTGMLSRLIEHSQQWRQETLEKLPESTAKEMKAEILAMLTKRERDQKVSSALLAVVANQPHLMEGVQAFHRERIARYRKEAVDATRCMLPLLAADGLYLLELLQVSPFSPQEREQLITHLLWLADELHVSGNSCAPDTTA